MTTPTQFRDGYREEDTYGTTKITTDSDLAYYLWISKESKWPNPKWTTRARAAAVGNYEMTAGTMSKILRDRTGMAGIVLQNGIPLYMVQGASSTAGADPYTHTITAGELPAFSLYHERTGTGFTDDVKLYSGCMVLALSLECSADLGFLRADMDWVSQNAVDPNLDGTNATLTNDISLPATANTDPYLFSQMTRTWDYGSGNVALDGLQGMKLSILPDLRPMMAHYTDSGTDKSHIPRGYYQANVREYKLQLDVQPETDDLWDELILTSHSKEIYFKWTRSTNDYIAITCTNCWPTDGETLTPDPDSQDPLVESYFFDVEQLSIEVKDSIAGDAGGAYGE